MLHIITIISLLLLLTFYLYRRKTNKNNNESLFEGEKYYIKMLPKNENPHYIIHYNHSIIPTYPPDINIYPKTLNALTATVVLNSGDMLYIPIGWFHCVVSEGDCIALSTNVMDIEEDDAVKYINRLSDFLFVLARHINKEDNYNDILWQKNIGIEYRRHS